MARATIRVRWEVRTKVTVRRTVTRHVTGSFAALDSGARFTFEELELRIRNEPGATIPITVSDWRSLDAHEQERLEALSDNYNVTLRLC